MIDEYLYLLLIDTDIDCLFFNCFFLKMLVKQVILPQFNQSERVQNFQCISLFNWKTYTYVIYTCRVRIQKWMIYKSLKQYNYGMANNCMTEHSNLDDLQSFALYSGEKWINVPQMDDLYYPILD